MSFCIVNLPEIQAWTRKMAVRLPDETHLDWLRTAVLRHALETAEGFRRADPTQAEAETPRVAWAVARGIGTLRWTPTTAIIQDCRLVVDWLSSLSSSEVGILEGLDELSFSKAVVVASEWRRRRTEIVRPTPRPTTSDSTDAPTLLHEPLFGNAEARWSWVWLKSLDAWKLETVALGREIGAGSEARILPSEAFLSLRDPSGKPHVMVYLKNTMVLEVASRWSNELTKRQHQAVAGVSAIVGPRLVLHKDATRRLCDGHHRRDTVSLYVRNELLHREDGPAIEWTDGRREWRWNGLFHRKGGPALEMPGGHEVWYVHGVRHREDGPAVNSRDGHREWYRDGLLHREDGPAMQHASGYRAWYSVGRLHRRGGPAVEHTNGGREWCRHGLLHRDDGPAVVYADGGLEWHRHGQLHRYDGPAIEHSSGEAEWFQNGRRHREDGPALCRLDGPDEWYLDGVRVAAEFIEERRASPSRR